MEDKREFDTTWDEIYGRREQLNLYPYDSVVKFLMRNYAKFSKRSDISVLEVGCGAGNNLWFAAREGFSVSGLDASKDAIEFAKSRFLAEGLQGEFQVGNFSNMPYSDSVFDVVIDRAALTHVNLSSARDAVAEVLRVLKSEGWLYSEVFSDHASSRGLRGPDDMVKDIVGPYQGAGQIYFYSRNDLIDMYNDGWELIDIAHTERIQYHSNGVEIYAHWSVVAQKVGDGV